MKKRTVIFLLTFVIIYVFNFFIPRFMPGDPFSTGNAGEVVAVLSEEEIARMKSYFGMDKPLWIQFTNTVNDNLSGNFGLSIYYKKTVASVIAACFPWTIFIMSFTLLSSLFWGIFFGLIGLNRPKLDAFFYTLMSIISEIPAFLIGIVLLFLIAAKVSWIPLSGNMTPFITPNNVFALAADIILHGLMPITAMVIITTPVFYFTARSSFLTIQDKKYMLAAKAKGLKKVYINCNYLLRNAMLPILSRLFLSVGACIGATLLVENVFAYPGLGRILREAVRYRDYMLIQGVFLLSATLVLTSSYLSDVINHITERITAHDN